MTDDLLEALSGPPPKDKRTRCYYADWFETLTPQRQEAFARAMSPDSKWKSTDIYDLARKAGYETQYNTLRSHRAGTCSCG